MRSLAVRELPQKREVGSEDRDNGDDHKLLYQREAMLAARFQGHHIILALLCPAFFRRACRRTAKALPRHFYGVALSLIARTDDGTISSVVGTHWESL